MSRDELLAVLEVERFGPRSVERTAPIPKPGAQPAPIYDDETIQAHRRLELLAAMRPK